MATSPAFSHAANGVRSGLCAVHEPESGNATLAATDSAFSAGACLQADPLAFSHCFAVNVLQKSEFRSTSGHNTK